MSITFIIIQQPRQCMMSPVVNLMAKAARQLPWRSAPDEPRRSEVVSVAEAQGCSTRCRRW